MADHKCNGNLPGDQYYEFYYETAWCVCPAEALASIPERFLQAAAKEPAGPVIKYVDAQGREWGSLAALRAAQPEDRTVAWDKEQEAELECLACGWVGRKHQLVAQSMRYHCPDCGTAADGRD